MDRLVEVRQTYVTAAEVAVHEAEARVRHFEEQAEENARQVRQSREEIAHLKKATGHDIQTRERHLGALFVRARQIGQDLDKAKKTLEVKRAEWRETMKARKIVERVQERRLQEWSRIVDVKDQKEVDEMSVGRHARNQSHTIRESVESDPAERSGSGS
jgi:flagellar export protein FliJ